MRPRMEDLWLGEKVASHARDPRPRHAMFLSAPPKRAHPDALDVVKEGVECRHVGWHRMVRKVPPDDLRQPCPLLGDRLVHLPSQLLLDLLELRPLAIPPRLPLDDEPTAAGACADEDEAQELEGLRFAEPAPRASDR